MNKTLFTILFLILLKTLVFGQTISFLHNTISRNAIVHLPTGYTHSKSYPLVFNLHGYGSNASQQEFYSQMNATADANGFIVVYPNGVSSAWNSGFVGSYRGGIDDVGFINVLIDTLKSRYNINLNRVYSCGMSNGGFQSYRLACDLSHRIAAVASVTGSMNDSIAHYCSSTRVVPIMQIHGTTDPTVPYGGTIGMWSMDRVIDFWKTRNTCASSPITTPVPNTVLTDSSNADFIKYTTCSSGSEIWFYKVYNGGHTWPGAVDISTLGYGKTCQDFNACQRIWDFFNLWTLTGPNTTIGLHEVDSNLISFYPIPANDKIIISPKENISITILNSVGTTVFEKSNTTQPLEIETMNWANGIYAIEVEQHGQKKIHKIIVCHE